MDFDQLNTFSEIAKQGSFSRAGQKLFRSQPAVSAQVRQLELEYGAKLFGRVGKTVRLTSAGETLYEYVQRMLTVRDESRRAVADQATRRAACCASAPTRPPASTCCPRFSGTTSPISLGADQHLPQFQPQSSCREWKTARSTSASLPPGEVTQPEDLSDFSRPRRC